MYSFVHVSCASKPALVPIEASTSLIFENTQINLKGALKQQRIVQGNVSIFYTTFAAQDASALTTLAERRKATFLVFFADSEEPYTGQKTLRSSCLKATEDKAVKFLAANDVEWGNCGSANDRMGQKFWKICGLNLWEITILNPGKKHVEAALTCN